ncbi:MAG: stage III sporulation protein AD [Turicibacter sp.]|nr:stage III sporulation protein AD [Turicibacter sp.]
MQPLNFISLIGTTLFSAVVYMLLHEQYPKLSKMFVVFLVVSYFVYASNLMRTIIQRVQYVFLGFDTPDEPIQLIIQLIGIVFIAEFINIFLAEVSAGMSGDLKNVGKVFDIIVKLFLIVLSLPMVTTLFELILTRL